MARLARLEIPAAPPGAATLRLRGWGYPYESPAQRLVVRLNGRELGRTELPRRLSTLSFSVPPSSLHDAPQWLELDVSPLVAPALRDPSSTDARVLGLALDWAALDPASPHMDLLR